MMKKTMRKTAMMLTASVMLVQSVPVSAMEVVMTETMVMTEAAETAGMTDAPETQSTAGMTETTETQGTAGMTDTTEIEDAAGITDAAETQGTAETAGILDAAESDGGSEAAEVQVIGEATGKEITLGEQVDLEDYEINISNVRISQNAGAETADPAHKYLCFDVSILNWLLEDLIVDPAAGWSVVYADSYSFPCTTYRPSLVGTWEGLATVTTGDEVGKQIYYNLEITEEQEDGTLTGVASRMSDNDFTVVECSWSLSGKHNKETGEFYLNFGDYIQNSHITRVSYYGTVQDSMLNITGYIDNGNELDVQMTSVDTGTEISEYNTAIAPLVEEVYELCVKMPNQAAAGFADGSLVLNMVIGDDNYTVTFEQEEGAIG